MRAMKIKIKLMLSCLFFVFPYCLFGSTLESQALRQYFELISWEEMKCDFSKFDIDAYSLPKAVPITNLDSIQLLKRKMSMELRALDSKIPESTKHLLLDLMRKNKESSFYTINIFAPKKQDHSIKMSVEEWHQSQVYFQLIKAKYLLNSSEFKKGEYCSLLSELEDDEKKFLGLFRKAHNCGSLEDTNKGLLDCGYQKKDWSLIFREYTERHPSFVLLNNKNRRKFYFDSKTKNFESLKVKQDSGFDPDFRVREANAQSYCKRLHALGASWKLPDLNDLLDMGYSFLESFSLERRADYSQIPILISPLIEQPINQRGFYLIEYELFKIGAISQSVKGHIVCVSYP